MLIKVVIMNAAISCIMLFSIYLAAVSDAVLWCVQQGEHQDRLWEGTCMATCLVMMGPCHMYSAFLCLSSLSSISSMCGPLWVNTSLKKQKTKSSTCEIPFLRLHVCLYVCVKVSAFFSIIFKYSDIQGMACNDVFIL